MTASNDRRRRAGLTTLSKSERSIKAVATRDSEALGQAWVDAEMPADPTDLSQRMQERFDGWWRAMRETFLEAARAKPVAPNALAAWAYKAGYELGFNNARQWIRGLSVRAYQAGFDEARDFYGPQRKEREQ